MYAGRISAPADDPEYKWLYREQKKQESASYDAQILIEDWEELDEIIAHFPDPKYPGIFKEKGKEDSRYKVACWWYCFFELAVVIAGNGKCADGFLFLSWMKYTDYFRS